MIYLSLPSFGKPSFRFRCERNRGALCSLPSTHPLKIYLKKVTKYHAQYFGNDLPTISILDSSGILCIRCLFSSGLEAFNAALMRRLKISRFLVSIPTLVCIVISFLARLIFL